MWCSSRLNWWKSWFSHFLTELISWNGSQIRHSKIESITEPHRFIKLNPKRCSLKSFQRFTQASSLSDRRGPDWPPRPCWWGDGVVVGGDGGVGDDDDDDGEVRWGSSRHLPYQIGGTWLTPLTISSLVPSPSFMQNHKRDKILQSANSPFSFGSFNCRPLTVVSSQDIPFWNCPSSECIYINRNTWDRLQIYSHMGVFSQCQDMGLFIKRTISTPRPNFGKISRKQFKRVWVFQYL